MSELSEQMLCLLDELIPFFNQADFDDLFESKVAHLNVGEQFALRNELQRLCEPCEKVIDLRKLVKAKCRKFIYRGRVHYLDELGIETFNQGIETYGQYTIGVFEAVNNAENNIKVQNQLLEQQRIEALKLEQQRKAQKLQHILSTKLNYSQDHYPVHLIRFGEYLNRQEERMNYSVPAKVLLADGSLVDGVTKDLSLLGLYLRIGQSHKVAEDDHVKVILTEQGVEYQQHIGEGIEYQIKRIEYLDGVIWLGLSRCEDDKTQWYSQHLQDLIASNKFVYKVNLDNAIDAALKQGHEQVFFARTLSACVFFETLGATQKLTYGLGSGRSVAMLDYFTDGKRCYLSSLLTPQVLKKLVDDGAKAHYLYCFTHKVEGQLLYFAAFDWQFENNDAIKALFCGYGAKKDSWRVFKLCGLNFAVKQDNLDMASGLSNSVFVLPNDAEQKKAEQKTDEQSVESDGQAENTSSSLPDLSRIKQGVVFTQVNSKFDSQSFVGQSYDASLMANIKDFQLYFGGSQSSQGIQWLYCGLEELRHESRYRYKTKVLVKLSLPDNASDTVMSSQVISATTADFSVRGLQLILPHSIEVQSSQLLYLSFPLLQKITRTLRLSDLPYKVVRTDVEQKVMYLQADVSAATEHHGVRFFRDLIKRNDKKLPLMTQSAARLNLVNGLKCLYQQQLVSAPCFINKVAGQNRLTKLVNFEGFPQALALLGDVDEQGKLVSNEINFAPFNLNEHLAEFIATGAGLNTGMDAKVNDEKVRSLDVFIAVKDNDNQEILDDSTLEVVFEVKTDLQLSSVSLQRQFVEQSLAQGRFFALRLYLYPVERVEVRKLANELAYIHHYAQHKSVHIAKLLTRIGYVGEWVDISDYVLQYLMRGE